MASSSSEAGFDEAINGSLFDGMVLFVPSPVDLSLPQVGESLPPPPDAATTSQPQSKPLPVDEDLFSDLTLQNLPSPTPSSLDPPTPSPLPAPTPTPAPPPSSHLQPPAFPSRQPSRKKKRAVRIGYARETAGPADALSEDFHHLSDPLRNKSPPPPPSSSGTAAVGVAIASKSIADEPPTFSYDLGVGAAPHPDTAIAVVENDPTPGPPPSKSLEQLREGTDDGSSCEPVVKEDEGHQPPMEEGEDDDICSSGGSAAREGVFDSAEERLQLVRTRISKKLESIQQRAASAYAERKELERRRRRAVETVNSASAMHKDLERELELACEAEDFERAERVSQNLMTMEEEKNKLLLSLREAEAGCEVAESKMLEVLELQIAAEEEGVFLLQQFSKDAADSAESVLKNAEKESCKELDEWQSSVELLEVKKLEMDIESLLVSEARSGLENAIEDLVKNDREEKEMLTRKGVVLAKELDELRELVILKEAEIADNKCQIQDVEKRISNVVFKFHETQSSIVMKHENLQAVFLKEESENEALFKKKKEIDENISLSEEKRKKLIELSEISSAEAKTCRDLVGLKKHLGSLVLKSREDRVKFSKTEEEILEDIQILREEILAARTALQDLSSGRASIQQEVALYKQRIDFIEKRGPELEAEKKVAAAARNFKEAGRVAAEAKALHNAKEDLQHKKEKSILHLEKLEEEIKSNVDKIQENEGLILLKEKEAALAGCNRLQLVAAAARAEGLAALKMGDLEEGNILLQEAEAAESEAREIQEVYNFDVEVDGKNFVSVAFITNLNGDHLTEVASLNLPAVAGTQSGLGGTE
ncbi:UvrB/uvrC motif [Musa troglodytarum]|uniref:UvrB/uvrC motif n=1 Tax=Musa troglodytarum TaxID=320322 RepID=A0A9E7HLT3_9LILI|nr:UvrB/uvrC motif [Musa troglodytarum]